jgi:hypothetical protein
VSDGSTGAVEAVLGLPQPVDLTETMPCLCADTALEHHVLDAAFHDGAGGAGTHAVISHNWVIIVGGRIDPVQCPRPRARPRDPGGIAEVHLNDVRLCTYCGWNFRGITHKQSRTYSSLDEQLRHSRPNPTGWGCHHNRHDVTFLLHSRVDMMQHSTDKPGSSATG